MRTSEGLRGGWWVLVPMLVAGVWLFSACGDSTPGEASDPGDPPPGREDGSRGPDDDPSKPVDDSGVARDGEGGATGDEIATEPNLKVAFIGDTAAGSDFRDVLRLIKKENAQAVVIQGDLTYSPDRFASDWFPVIDNEINKAWPGSTADTTIPYFIARGNHDADWAGIGGGLAERMTKWGVASEHNDPTKINYSVVFKGLKIVMVAASETSNPTRADYVVQRLANDKHVWKMCSWHKNQRATNVGPKSDEMGWEIYENCREAGAIVAQGHSHTYSRSKTVTNDQNQTVDPACNDPFALCVAPGRHFFFDSSLGGVDTRSLNSVASRPYWASTYTGNYGALFIEFNVDGDPKKARGYFKTVGNVLIDPPPASGKTAFTITRSP